MQRALFLVEQTGERHTALINPDRLEFTRHSGVQAETHATGAVTGLGLSDNPVRATGGGTTEMTFDLLFDVDLADAMSGVDLGLANADAEREKVAAGQALPQGTATADVRELTRPFWNLAENGAAGRNRGEPPLVRFIWGRSWNVLGIIVAIAERFERFNQEGQPRRSFMRARLRRMNETERESENSDGFGRTWREGSATPFYELRPPATTQSLETAERILIATEESGLPNPRLDQLAAQYLGDAARWRDIATANSLADPLHLEAGAVLVLPSPAKGEAA